MRPLLFVLVLSIAASLPARATWRSLDARGVSAIDLYDAHSGLVSFLDPTHTVMKIQDSSLLGLWSAPGAVTGIVIQDSTRAWAVISQQGLYLGDKGWSNWTNTSTRTDLHLVAATPTTLFVFGSGQLFSTTDGTTFNTVIGITDSITAMDHISQTLLIAVSNTKIYRSSDGGLSWHVAQSGMTLAASVFADRVHGVVFTGGDELRMSSDSGKTWAIVYAPLEMPSFHELDGQVFGAHDCTGTFYISNGPNHGSSILRSETQGRTFVDCDIPPQSQTNILKGWTFDRGSLVYWWDMNNQCSFSRDGLTGLITDSVKSAIDLATDPITDTLCTAPTKPLTLRIASEFCVGIRIDSLSVVRSAGLLTTKFASHTLINDSMTIGLTYTARTVGVDSTILRVWFHSVEWGVREHKDVAVIATVTTMPAVLAAPNKLDFGAVHTDSTKTATINISNTGCSALRVDSAVSSNPAIFMVSGTTFPASVASNASLTLRVSFTPHAVGDALESIELGTSAGHVFIELDGFANKELNAVDEVSADVFAIYPNPASAMLTVRSDERGDAFVLYDVLGREVFRAMLFEGDNPFDISNIPNGFYTAMSGTRSSRLIVQH